MEHASRWLVTRVVLVLGMAVLLLLLVTAPQSSQWPFALVGAACLAAVWDGYAGIFRMLKSPRRARKTVDQIEVCLIWLVNTLAYLTLLNTAAELAMPGTFEWRGGPATALDVAYLTCLTFASSGYGDVLPVTTLGKGLAMLTSMCGFLYATMLFTAFWQHFSISENVD